MDQKKAHSKDIDETYIMFKHSKMTAVFFKVQKH